MKRFNELANVELVSVSIGITHDGESHNQHLMTCTVL